jgi:hypothetical protein
MVETVNGGKEGTIEHWGAYRHLAHLADLRHSKM